MSLHSDYIRERLGQESIEHEWGFLTYKIIGDVVEVGDFYISPAERRSGKSDRLGDELLFRAKQAGAKRIAAWVWPGMPNADGSIKVLFRFGFKLHSNDGARTILVKELGDESNG